MLASDSLSAWHKNSSNAGFPWDHYSLTESFSVSNFKGRQAIALEKELTTRNFFALKVIPQPQISH